MSDKTETKEQAFRRLAEKRIVKAVNAIRLIGNLGGYPHTHEHTSKILAYLRGAVDGVEYRLGGEKKSAEKSFSLDDEADTE